MSAARPWCTSAALIDHCPLFNSVTSATSFDWSWTKVSVCEGCHFNARRPNNCDWLFRGLLLEDELGLQWSILLTACFHTVDDNGPDHSWLAAAWGNLIVGFRVNLNPMGYGSAERDFLEEVFFFVGRGHYFWRRSILLEEVYFLEEVFFCWRRWCEFLEQGGTNGPPYE